jgi:hypothetical protein
VFSAKRLDTLTKARGERTRIMNKNSNHRNGCFHLYNPKEEGLGSYDVHYINAYKKIKNKNQKLNEKANQRYAA